MQDLISRQAAIDALKGHRALFCDNTPDTFSKLSYGEKCRVDELDTAISTLVDLPPAQPTQTDTSNTLKALDCVERRAAIDALMDEFKRIPTMAIRAKHVTEQLPSVQPEVTKYEYHYDHTDCIWYRPEARNRCPVTCAQYRDGWNDAMNYIFRDGKGYRPYRRDEQYGE